MSVKKYIIKNILILVNMIFIILILLNHIYLTLGTWCFSSHVKIFLFYTKFLSSNSNDANAIKDDVNITSLTLKVHFDSYVFEVLFYIFSPCKFFTHLFSSISKRKLERVWRKGNPPTLLVGMQTSTATMENSVEIPWKIANRTTLWPSNPTAGHTHWGNQNWKRHMYPNVHRSTVYNSQDMETT